MRVGSLFSGYGGLELAVQALWPDATMAWHSEIDKGAKAVLASRFPEVPNLGDITEVDWNAVEPVDVITGGSPCQDLSNAGSRLGMTEGTRSNLWVAMREAIATLRPSLVIWENVRGAMSAAAASNVEPCAGCMGDRGREPALRALGRVLGDLADLGYDAQWHGLRAADIGLAHGRWRVFVVAYPRGEVGIERTGLRTDEPTRNGWGLTPRGGGPDGLTLLPTPAVNDMGEGKTVEYWDEWAPRQKSADGRPAPHGKSLAIEAQRQPERWGQYAAAIALHESVLGRSAPDATQLSTKGNPQLAPAFVEWLMGLPEGWITDVDDVTRNQMLKMLGNGVVPQQAAAAVSLMLGRAA